ncbi:PEP-CTERM sorting domain-containing protein [Massilia sp. W12]|uniref:PEP-CTERM sorting domain-containing protein n=1 Tax=Massilia sp. W12 TaxID=3126507 RepID=UPI0030CE4925
MMTHTSKLQVLIAAAFLSVSSMAQADNYQASEITANMRDMTDAQVLIAATDDAAYKRLLPFNFVFNDRIYSEISFSTNGILSFTSQSNGCCGSDVLNNGATAYMGAAIAPFWTDWISTVKTKTFGDAGSRELVFNWSGYEYGNNPAESKADFQVILHEGSNRIEFQYGQNSLRQHHAVGGIQTLNQEVTLFSHHSSNPAFQFNNRGFMVADMNPSSNPLPGGNPNPVPEAETWAMMGAGLGALALMARRRRKAQA